MKLKMFVFIRKNAPYSDYESEPILWEQTRAIFTTFCLISTIEVEEEERTKTLNAIYEASETKVDREWFDKFMLDLLV